MKIIDLTAYPISYPIPEDQGVDAGHWPGGGNGTRFLVKVVTESGLVGWGEAPCRPRARRRCAIGQHDAAVPLSPAWRRTRWSTFGQRVYKMQLASHGMGAACAIAMSGCRPGALGYSRQGGWAGRFYRLLGGAAKKNTGLRRRRFARLSATR